MKRYCYMDSNILKTIKFENLEKWYVEYYLNKVEIKSKFKLIKLKDIITPVKRKIKKNDYDGVLPVVSKIVFKTGEIVFRNENKTGMDLYNCKVGELLISSINFHQGAVAYNDIKEFVCSTHYQIYEINKNFVIPQYLVFVLRSETFVKKVSSVKANGIKNESGYDFIGQFDIPVPTIKEQKEILKEYNDTLKEIEKLKEKLLIIERKKERYLFT